MVNSLFVVFVFFFCQLLIIFSTSPIFKTVFKNYIIGTLTLLQHLLNLTNSIMATNQDDNNKADPYKLLNVERDATPKQIRKAYYALSRLVHPDRNTAPDAVESFQALNKAWGILSDPDKRKLFDKTGCTDQDSEAFWNAYQQYRTVYPEVTAEDVEAFAKSYRNSDEEKTDLRDYYNQKKGDISFIMATIMCSETTDADRFVGK